ncbi:MAG: hypothetical protein WC595_03530 [Candidatus Nanoarchaeia archaeon]
MTKYVVVGGSTATGTGKTVFTASLAYLLSTHGLNVTAIKFDGILNLDFSTIITSNKIKPEVIWEGEEVFLTKQHELVDSDVGVYERFINKDFTSKNNIINGACYYQLFLNQLNHQFAKGEIITVNSHLIPLYLKKIEEAAKGSDICFIEIGGTLGDNESLFFLRALSALKNKDPSSVLFILYSYLPLKSSLDQLNEDEPFLLKIVKQSYEKAMECPLKPDLLAIRSDKPVLSKHKSRIQKDTFLYPDQLLLIPSIKDIYQLPLKLLYSKEYEILFSMLHLKKGKRKEGSLEKYSKLPITSTCQVLILGETESSGSYISLKEAIKHALRHIAKEPNIIWMKGRELTSTINLNTYDYIILTEGNEALELKHHLIKNTTIPTLILGKFAQIIKSPYSFPLSTHQEYRSRPMFPTLLNFFKLKWKNDN